MKRVIILAALTLGLAVPSLASAHHTAHGASKRAVLRGLAVKFHAGPLTNNRDCGAESVADVPCYEVIISANSWATAVDNGPGNGGAAEWTNIAHLIHGRWRYEGGWGEGIIFACARKGMPASVARDLKVPCR
jgi:hypothetical protein